jgi:hypothetical protein
MQRLPPTTQLLYVELLQQCATALPNQRGISFVTKPVSGHRYWYMELVAGSTKRQFSLGRDSAALREQIDKQKALYAEAAPDLKQREKLVAMLVSGGAIAPGASDGRVLEVLAQSGVFLAGGVLVGSHAFNAYGNMLGVKWDSAAMQTQDMDLASHRQIEVALRQDAPDVKSVLLESGMGFFEVPALNSKVPSTSFKVRGQEFHVDLLTPSQGAETGKPVYLPHFHSHAHPMRFLEYLLNDSQGAVIPFHSGLFVSVPHPARFALHKLVVSRRRPVALQIKARKDVQQATELLNLLLEDRPGDIWIALEAAQTMPGKFLSQLTEGIEQLPTDLKQTIGEHLNKTHAGE